MPGPKLVLIVEDDRVIRILSADLLLEAGVGTLEAADGEEAFELLERRATEIAAVVTDIRMPAPATGSISRGAWRRGGRGFRFWSPPAITANVRPACRSRRSSCASPGNPKRSSISPNGRRARMSAEQACVRCPTALRVVTASAQAGFDCMISRNWGLNADVKYITIGARCAFPARSFRDRAAPA